MHLETHFIPGLAIASHLVGDESAGVAAVIDPTRDVQPLLDAARKAGLRITHVLETHVHADFVSGARELKAALDGAPEIVCSGLGGDEWTPKYADRVVRDGDSVALGRVRLTAVHTPGHTPEHVAWAVFDTARSAETPCSLFTGDFLFVGDVGRPDLLGEEEQQRLAHELYDSLFTRIAGLPDGVEILPSHGAGSLCGKSLSGKRRSTLGYERAFSDALQQQAEDRWVAALMDGMPPSPPYFRRMKALNAAEPPVLGGLPIDLPALSPGAVAERTDGGAILLDVRSKEAFAAAHIAGSLNIPLADQLATWAGWVLPADRPILLIADDRDTARAASRQLSLVGFDEQVGRLDGSLAAWESAGRPTASYPAIDAPTFKQRIAASETAVLDVRTDAEWNGGHVPGAVHVHAGLLPKRLDEVPRDEPLAVVCGSGYRGAIAASLLRRAGFEQVSNVLGGMAAYQAAGGETTTAD